MAATASPWTPEGQPLCPPPMVTRGADFPEIGFFQLSGTELLPAKG